MNLFFGWIILLVHLVYLQTSDGSPQPHIVIIYADDLGWNDISYHGSPQIPTPNIDALALNGITLQNYYGEWLCTPSRASLLTGKYPMRLGLQHFVIRGGEASGLPLNETTMAQRLKKLGYATHMIGKWHLGYQTKEYTPTYRGFDTFFGYWNGLIDYYDHTYQEFNASFGQPYFGLDLHDGMDTVKSEQGKYATHFFTEKAEEVIKKHDTSKPLFMYFAQLAAHAGNGYQRMQAPPDVVEHFKYVKDLNRRIHAGIVKVMDDSVGSVFRALHEKNMLENTIFLFISDNGGQVNPMHGGFGTNYPLRGNKYTYWEGGIHLPAIIWSPLLNLKKPQISNQLMHVSDWLPTLYKLAGGSIDDLGPIDGIDMWQSLVDDSPSPRTDMLQNLDPIAGTSAFRQGHLKVTNGTIPSDFNVWLGPSGLENFNGPTTYEWVFKNGSVVRDVLLKMGLWIVEDPDDVYENLRITCEQPPPKEAFECDPLVKPCLFNVTADPCEYYDIADQNPDAVKEMMDKILKYKSEEMWPQSKEIDPAANPMCHHFQYVPWMDPDHSQECDFLYDDESVMTY
ncbi:Arylsulfatase B like protein [Argiope bruennichi]|uniref:Arylsulfatase B like protein n=1 Tax=Argiope bruennichi TaxID=94029 RepID=A0A8T0FL92_ARGBR|nr:Arylsulfatase B like protein [Argiope bruennichi]